MTSTSLKLSLLCCLAIPVATLKASILYTGGTYSENFDSLPDTTTADYFGNVANVQTALPGTTGWEGTPLSTTSNGMDLVRVNFPSGTSTGHVGSAGEGTIAGGDNERAISILASGSWTPAMGVEIVNGTSTPLEYIDIQFTQELWRTAGDDSAGTTPGVVNTVIAEWATTAGSITSSNFLSVGSDFTAVPSLNLVSPAPISDTSDPEIVDGNLPENQVLRSATIVFSTLVAPGESFYLRFHDSDEDGRDAILAIDNFSFRTNAIPEPCSVVLCVAALAMGIAVRRRWS